MKFKKAKMEPPNKCLIWHRWRWSLVRWYVALSIWRKAESLRLVRNTGATQYYECKDCGARFARTSGKGHQPIDIRWIAGLPSPTIDAERNEETDQ